MPVPVRTPSPAPLLFPPLTVGEVDAARTSAWYDTFEDITFTSTIVDIDALGEREAFLEWLHSDSIFMPEDVEASPTDPDAPVYRLPKTSAAIRAALRRYGGAVFPKLNWTAPRDAAFLLPQTEYGPLHCIAPDDVYLLLKSSDFIQHDLDADRAYEGCVGVDAGAERPPEPRIELVLKKFVELNPAREVRCFVRDNVLLAVSQRDTNFYDHLQDPEVQQKLVDNVRAFWEDEVRGDYAGGDDYIFDLYLDERNTSATIMDFQPYRPATDSYLFSYPELQHIFVRAQAPIPEGGDDRPRLPVLRVIDSAAHPEANRNAPAFSANMMPLEMLEMSQGRSLAELQAAWEAAMAAGLTGDGDDDSDDDSVE
ncbi:hypothetical protein VHUM_02951 [Vanrija humicola]|uniref:Uncharacterized protein n=1 Tax=Vanrija humicola TaxID=5417 RepID=A0A7D8Z2Y3_VANHU|nr:hypothetical protein VHUM_02951 [Vanrija humicola]